MITKKYWHCAQSSILILNSKWHIVLTEFRIYPDSDAFRASKRARS